VVIYDVEKGTANSYTQLPGACSTLRVSNGRLYFDTTSFIERLSLVSLDDAHGKKPLTHGTAADRQPSFARDGKSILFSSNMSGNLDVWRLDLATGALSRITDDPGDDFDPAYTPDGRILFSSDRTGHFEIWTAESDGSGARQLSHDGFDAENGAMSPDGQWIYYNGYGSHAGIWRMHADGSNAERIITDSSELPELSPDGTMIAYHRNEPKNEIQVVRLSDRKSFRFAMMTSRRFPASAPGRSRWLPDGSGLLYVDSDDQGHWGVYRQPLVFGEDTKSQRKPVAGFDADAPTESLGVSADGRSVIISEAWPVTTIMSAENVPMIARE
jgi:TolB protein